MQASSITAAIAAGMLLLAGASASVAASRAWVSGHGVDQAGCGTPVAPCRSLQYAHDHVVAVGGEIDILDPAGYGAITITKAVSIVNDGVGTAGVQSNSGAAITVNADPSGSVYLRGLNIDGVNFTGSTGVQFNAGATLTMVGCVVRHFTGYGIALTPAANATHFNVSDTVSSENGGGGVLAQPNGTFVTDVVIDRLTAQSNGANGVTVDGDRKSVV